MIMGIKKLIEVYVFHFYLFHQNKPREKLWKSLLFYWENSFQKQPPEMLYQKKVFLKILQNSQENTCARVDFLIKLQSSDLLLY